MCKWYDKGMDRYQSGSVRKKVIIISVVLALIVGGWVVWLIFFQAKPASVPEVQTDQESAEQGTVSDTTRYLVIKEWGVKLPLSDNLTDASYYMRDGEVLLTTSRIQTACILPASQCSIATLTRSTTGDEEYTEIYDADSDDGDGSVVSEVKIGDYYYQFDDSNEEGWRYQFADNDTQASKNAIATDEAFMSSFQKLVAE